MPCVCVCVWTYVREINWTNAGDSAVPLINNKTSWRGLAGGQTAPGWAAELQCDDPPAAGYQGWTLLFLSFISCPLLCLSTRWSNGWLSWVLRNHLQLKGGSPTVVMLAFLGRCVSYVSIQHSNRSAKCFQVIIWPWQLKETDKCLLFFI